MASAAASTVLVDPEEAVFLFTSVIRGHHVYKSIWTPVMGEVLTVSLEEGNAHVRFAVRVKKERQIVGHVPREFSREIWHFFRHGCWSTCVITGTRLRGNGLEVPCVYRFVAK